jgi:hypothetical protein
MVSRNLLTRKPIFSVLALGGIVAFAGLVAVALSFVIGGSKASSVAPALAAPAIGRHHHTFKPDGTKLAGCSTASCYEQAFGNAAYRRGPRYALAVFSRDIRTNRTVRDGCHRIAHTLGAAALVHFHGNVSRALADGSPVCWSGYYHGVLEHALAGVRTKPQFVAAARAACASRLVHRTQWVFYQCVHGLGHGLMLQSGDNLPFALSVCDRLQTGWDRSSCSGGVFMENINAGSGLSSGHTRWLRRGDLVYPCNTVSQRHKLYCYLMVTSRILQANGYDWRQAARICTRVEKGWVSTCFQSYGRDADGYSVERPAKVLTLCGMTGSHEGDCLYGAARDMTADLASGKRASVLCARAPAGYRARCFYGIGTIAGTFSARRSARAAACAGLSRPYAEACRRGARS